MDLNDCDLDSLAEIRKEMSLLEMGVQLMILPTTSFRTMNATPFCHLSLQVQCQIFRLSLPCVGIHQDVFWYSNYLELQVFLGVFAMMLPSCS